jgi:hypothetical protein
VTDDRIGSVAAAGLVLDIAAIRRAITPVVDPG